MNKIILEYKKVLVDKSNTRNRHRKNISRLNESDSTIYYHGSLDKFDKFNHETQWFSTDYDYAKYYVTSTGGYMYSCELFYHNLFDIGSTGRRVYTLLPIKPYKFSKDILDIANKLNINHEELERIVNSAIEEWNVTDEDIFRLKLSTIARSHAFRELLLKRGYDGIKAVEYNVPKSRYCDTYCMYNPEDIKILKVEEVSKNESLKESRKAITFGDLDYAKKTDTRGIQMQGRGTGHFGTGFYFVGADGPYGINGSKFFDYEPTRPIYEIDLDAYKLYKPRDNETAYALHDAFKYINNYYVDDIDKYLFNRFNTAELKNKLYDIGWHLQEDFDDDLSDLDIDLNYDDLSDAEADKKYEDNYKKVAKKFIQDNELERFLNTNSNDLDYWLESSKPGKIEDAIEKAIDDKDELIYYVEKGINKASDILRVSKNDILDIVRKAYKNKSQDTLSTQIMKSLGYEGIDVTHLNHDDQGLSGLDNFGYGTVIYDLKPGTFKRIIEPRKKGNIHSKDTVTEDYKNTEETLELLDKAFGQEDLYMWSTYILPNGHFLNPDNCPEYWEEIDEEPVYEHWDFEEYVHAHGGNVTDVYDSCMKMNVTVPYISLPDKAKWTTQQQESFRKIIEANDFQESLSTSYLRDVFDPALAQKYFNNSVGTLIAIYTPVGDTVFDLGVSSADDIIKAINTAYVRGGFNESLDEYLETVRPEDESDYPVTVYTYQSPEVLKQLKNGKTYTADYNRGMLSNNAYQELSRILDLNNCPIFGGLSEEETEEMMNSSNIDINDKVLLKLKVPSSEVHQMGYYDWSDYIYYWIDGQEEDSISKEDAENTLRNYSGDTPIQVVINRIEPEWLNDSDNIKESLKEIEQTGILISTSLYEIKDKILNSKKPLKLVGTIVNEEETWLIGNPYGDTHEDMLAYAEQYGYLSGKYEKKNNLYLNTVPYNKKINVFVDYSEGMEYDYDNTRIVDVTKWHNYDNTNSFENTELFRVLGEPRESKKYLYKDHINEEDALNESIHLIDENDKNLFYTYSAYDLKNFIDGRMLHGAISVIRVCYYASQGLYCFCDAYEGIHDMLEEIARAQGIVYDDEVAERYVIYASDEEDYDVIDYSDGIIYNYGDFRVFEVTAPLDKGRFIDSGLYEALGKYKDKYKMINGQIKFTESLKDFYDEIDDRVSYISNDSKVKGLPDINKRYEEVVKELEWNKSLIVEKIVQLDNGKWQVQSEKGKNLGTYDTKKEAEKRLQQVHYFKHMNEKLSRGNTFVFNGKNYWCGAVNTLDGVIEEVHTYEEANSYDFHHSLYFSDEQLENMGEGISCFFYVYDNEIVVDPIGRNTDVDVNFLKNEINKQIKLIESESLSDNNTNVEEELLQAEQTDRSWAFDAWVVESPYEAKRILDNSKDAMRVFIDENKSLYIIGRAYECTHSEMIELAKKNGYNTDIDDYDKNKVCIVYSPKDEYNVNYDFDEVEASEDDYTYMYVYDKFTIFSRYQDFEKFELCEILGDCKKFLVKPRRY